jgi:DNA ligase 1
MRTLYKYDTKGKLRIWKMEIQGDKYRTIAGLADGKQTTSAWTVAEPKNVGRANETTGEQQALAEVEAAYTHKLTREYHETPEAASGGAHYYKPMLAEKYNGFPLWQPSYAQPKLDGMRCIATKDGLFSRQGKPIVSCPHIVKALEETFYENPDLVLDGELYNHDLKDDFPRLMSLCRKEKPDADELAETEELVEYHIYDAPSVSDNFGKRSAHIQELACEYEWHPCIEVVVTWALIDVAGFNALHGEWIAAGYEGSILRLDKSYEQKRSKNLLKRKDFITKEFAVARLEQGTGNWANVIKSVVCIAENGKEFGSGLKGSHAYAKSLMGKTFKTATVRYFELTPDGVPRFGIVVDLHEGERVD